MEFNVELLLKPIFRSYRFFRTVVVGGSIVTVYGPSLVAAGVTEVNFELLTDNGASVSVVNQFDTTGTCTGLPLEAITIDRTERYMSMADPMFRTLDRLLPQLESLINTGNDVFRMLTNIPDIATLNRFTGRGQDDRG